MFDAHVLDHVKIDAPVTWVAAAAFAVFAASSKVSPRARQTFYKKSTGLAVKVYRRIRHSDPQRRFPSIAAGGGTPRQRTMNVADPSHVSTNCARPAQGGKGAATWRS
ncbi:MAG TPA: hypothetical protein VGY52_09665 [Roseiarcus sp.]|jgi:hypothetical protein|nr:hypothetical protein [Roseiarcus sp.]